MARPVIMSVDDDPEVLNAVERDLRVHYGSDYRILKSGAPAAAIDVARQLQERGTPVAMFLVDQRMPGMSGNELLTEVRKLHPDARKVLLTAYADTQAAISSINDVELDYYLLKPWHPPEERLYPVLDDLLSDWKGVARVPYEGIRVVGSTWSATCYSAKQFLAGNHAPYQWIELERDTAIQEVVRLLAGDPPQLPVILFPDGTHLVAPSSRQLAEKIGIQTRAQLAFYDLIIVGAGPAGLAAAVYGASEGLHTLMIEESATGGQAGTSSRIENYLGFPAGVSGSDLARRATDQARRFGAELVTAQEAVGIRREDPYRVVQLSDGSEVSTKAVVLAMGVSVRQLNSGEEQAIGAAAAFIFIGAAPRTDMLAGAVERDDKGYILTGPDLPLEKDRPKGWLLDRDPYLYETSTPGVFAVGDVRAGSGKRVAAAVGEGSATVSMVHRYLETV